MEKQHTFVICAYQESEYLEECIRSLMRQTVKSEILMATSTPNPYIKKVSEKYAIPLYVNTGERGITQDWNFAYRQAKTPLVTIAHQDDVYAKNYTELVLEYLKKSRDPLLLFTDYGELRDGVTVLKNHLLQIKRQCFSHCGFRCSEFHFCKAAYSVSGRPHLLSGGDFLPGTASGRNFHTGLS